MNTKIRRNCHSGTRRLRLTGRVVALSLLLAGPPLASADVVSDWNQTAETIYTTGSVSLPPGSFYAMVHLAIYDAVNAIDHKHTAYAIHPVSPTEGASEEAAAVAAAYTVLKSLVPDQVTSLDEAYADSLAEVPDGPGEDLGVALGKEVANGLLALRADDLDTGAGDYTFSYEPGDYQATPPGYVDPILPALGRARPYALKRGSQFRAEGPPDLTSVKYTIEFREVKRLGGATSTVRTPEQTEIALFYLEGPATFWTRNYRNFIREKGLSTSDAARLYAMLSTAYADASIACWDSKYYFNSWRPVTAIQNAGSDGNPGTGEDPAWEPLAITPPHPEYPSAHSCNTSAMNEMLRAFYGTGDIPMTLTSLIPGTRAHHFDNLDQQTAEVIEARILAGFHFRSANIAGVELGRRVGRYIAMRYFLPEPQS